MWTAPHSARRGGAYRGRARLLEPLDGGPRRRQVVRQRRLDRRAVAAAHLVEGGALRVVTRDLGWNCERGIIAQRSAELRGIAPGRAGAGRQVIARRKMGRRRTEVPMSFPGGRRTPSRRATQLGPPDGADAGEDLDVGAGVDDRRRADEVGGVAELVGVLVPHLHRAEGRVISPKALRRTVTSRPPTRGCRFWSDEVIAPLVAPSSSESASMMRPAHTPHVGFSLTKSRSGAAGRATRPWPSPDRRREAMASTAASSSGVRTSVATTPDWRRVRPCAQQSRPDGENADARSAAPPPSREPARAATGARGADVSVYEGVATRKLSMRVLVDGWRRLGGTGSAKR